MTDNLFAVCQPRADVPRGTLEKGDFTADLSRIPRGHKYARRRLMSLGFLLIEPTR